MLEARKLIGDRPMRRLLPALTLGVVTTLCLAGSAGAASLTYIKNHEVWLASPSGSIKTPLTNTGTAKVPWRSPSQVSAH